MTLAEIQSAVESGQTVHWSNTDYRVVDGGQGGWLVKCEINDHCIGLTWRDGVTMDFDPQDFFVVVD